MAVSSERHTEPSTSSFAALNPGCHCGIKEKPLISNDAAKMALGQLERVHFDTELRNLMNSYGKSAAVM